VSVQRNDLFSVEGRTAVLTGASGFLGGSMAETLLSNGARVVLLGRSNKLVERQRLWESRFGAGKVAGHQIDMYDLKAVEQVLDAIAAEGAVDIVVNNAHELGRATGFNDSEGSLEKTGFEQWNRNLIGGAYWPALVVQRLLPALKQSGSASIINISTMYAIVAPSPKLYAGTDKMNPPGYSASKAAMLALTRYMASFLGEYGIRANAILPGPFSNTGDDGENSVDPNDPFLARLEDRTCLGRIGRPEELSGALLFLASAASSFITGQGIVVDGGWTVT
jgi:gluconate 5-dehydrogenase